MDVTTIGGALGLGAGIAGVTALIKAAFPALPSRRIPLLVLALSAAVVGIGLASGELTMRPLEALLAIIGQAVTALGAREGVAAVAPRVSTLPSRGAGSAGSAGPNPYTGSG